MCLLVFAVLQQCLRPGPGQNADIEPVFLTDAKGWLRPAGTAQQQSIKRTNQECLVRLVKASVIASVAETAVELDFESYEQALSLREQITDLVDDLLTDSGVGDDLYGPLADLRASVTVHFDGVASSLPELQEYMPIITMPALLLAYQIYGDISREPEILARNPSIRDQSAVPGWQAIKVLIDG